MKEEIIPLSVSPFECDGLGAFPKMLPISILDLAQPLT